MSFIGKVLMFIWCAILITIGLTFLGLGIGTLVAILQYLGR